MRSFFVRFLFVGASKLNLEQKYNQELYQRRLDAFEALKNIDTIPELSYNPTRKYYESTKASVLDPLINDANCVLVPGAYFGDEGKGKTVDAVAQHQGVSVVARVNSGENAGHTVIGPAPACHEYHFHLCPSGLLTPGKVNMIGPECVMDPVSFMQREITQLAETGVEYKDRLFIGNVHLVCPHHKLLDLMGSWKAPNKSTLQGMGPVHASKSRRRGLRLDHLFNSRASAKAQLQSDLAEYYGMMKVLNISEEELLNKAQANKRMQKHVLDFVCAQDKADYVLDLFDKVYSERICIYVFCKSLLTVILLTPLLS